MIKERKHILKLIQTTHKEISMANSHNAALSKDLKGKNKIIEQLLVENCNLSQVQGDLSESDIIQKFMAKDKEIRGARENTNF